MEKGIEECFFGVLLRTLNYSIEFINQTGYASMRFMDLFEILLELQPFIKEISQKEFYERLREKIKSRPPFPRSSEVEARSKLQSELLQMFIDEGMKTS